MLDFIVTNALTLLLWLLRTLSSTPLLFFLAGGAAIQDNSYRYTDSLLALEAVAGPPPPSPPVEGFLPLDAWSPLLSSHPDQRFAAFLRRGITHGFRIGADPAKPLRTRNLCLPSAADHADIISDRISEELASGKLHVPHSESSVRHISPIGVIPKPHQPGKFRLIVDLSAPRGYSVNDAISSDLATLRYVKVEEAARLIATHGKSALLAKLDLHSAYRKVPVHSEDQPLLAINWKGTTYIDHALPFGLRSAPKIFTAVADGYAWGLSSQGVTDFVHYLDDFLFWSPPGSPACASALQTALRLGAELGLPAAPGKVEGPSTSLTFLGIEIDTLNQVLRLPVAKLTRLKQTLRRWQSTTNPTKRELQSLIGLLNHAAAVVRPGRSFIRNLIENMKSPRLLDQPTRLTAKAKADIAWWRFLVAEWNGVGFFPLSEKSASLQVFSDASGSWGCGAFTETTPTLYFQFHWSSSWASAHIAAKELLPVVAGAALWGKQWENKLIVFRSDNSAAVEVLNNRSAADPTLTYLLQCLFFFEAYFQFDHVARHVSGRDNVAADALSRNRLPQFVALFPQGSTSSMELPASLQRLLLQPPQPWTSAPWRDLLRNCLQEVSHPGLNPPTAQPKKDT